jgi:signal peptidase I
MFGFFTSAEKKLRQSASQWLEIADRVWSYRRDELKPEDSVRLLQAKDKLRAVVDERGGVDKLKAAITALETVLGRVGGRIYPRTSFVDNVEFLLMAAIVMLGIRTYIVQTFKIPTNSMWPTYYGMTPEVFAKPADEPGPLKVAARAVVFGAWPHRLNAPADGEVLVPMGQNVGRGLVHYRIVPGRKWLVIPTQLREYTLLVGDEPVTVRVPLDFDFDWAVYDAFLNQGESYSVNRLYAAYLREERAGRLEIRTIQGKAVQCLRTGRTGHRGERVLSFDEMTGDNLLVDRISYHFMRPRVGSGVVFRTGNIPALSSEGDQYYVKRLVGLPGDTLEVSGTTLLRNGAPITGSAAFEANAQRLGKYPGYEALGSLGPGQTVTVEPRSYFGMGDNSPNSGDSRMWGFIPEKDVAGRPLFVYYPFTARWGPAK